MMIAINAIYGIALLALMVAGQAMVVTFSGPDDYDRNFGWFTAAASLGQMLGPVLLGSVLTGSRQAELLAGTTRGFWVAAGVAVGVLLFYGAMGVLAHRTGALATRSEDDKASAGRGSALGLLRDRQLTAAIVVSFMFIAGVDLIIAYMPVLGHDRGLSPAFVGILLGVRAASAFLSRLVLGVLIRVAGRLTVIAVSGVVAAVMSFALVTTTNHALLCGIMVLLGITLGLGQPLTMTWVVHRAPEQLRATALALRISGNRLAQSAAPAGAGALSVVAGVAGPFVLISGLMCVAALAVVPFLRR